MPLFEYACRGCGRQFEAFVTADRAASCPSCESVDLQKLLSSPSMVGTGGGRRDAAPMAGCKAQGGHCGCSHNSSIN
jgi:putative FmdB family regulatory protein